MKLPPSHRLTTRRSLLRSGVGAFGAGVFGSFFPQLELLAASCPLAGSGDYKALVCINLSGGNDSWNLLVPRDASGHAQYLAARGGAYDAATNPAGLGISQSSLLAVSPQGGGDFGLHPSTADFSVGGQTLPGLQSLFSQGDLAFLANIGTLRQPLTKAEYNSFPSLRPPQLFSHNDQTTLWHLGRTDPNFKSGWGGQIGDLIAQCNANQSLSPCISVSGNNRFQIGQTVFPYPISTTGPVAMIGYTGAGGADQARALALQSMLDANAENPYAAEYSRIQGRSLDLYADLSAALAVNTLTTPTPTGNTLADQLAIVARLIKSRTTLGQSRQVYFVNLGGFDTHDAQMGANGQPLLIQRLSQAVGFFHAALSEIGMLDQVITFTLSEFGRTLNSNGNGTDHAWGGVQLVMGGSILGQRIYGTYPELLLDGPISLARGQMIPGLAVDQLGATLGAWMGASSSEIAAIFPNLGNFSASDLGFIG